jgi:hypothetical protein
MSSYLTTSAASSTYAALSGATFSGDVRTYRTASTTTGVYYFSQSGDKYLYYDGTYFTLNGGYVYNASSFRAPIFYDSDNTGYYVDPASTSSIRKTNLTCSGSGWDDGLNIYSSAGTNRWNFLTDSGASNAMRIAYNNSEAININTGIYTTIYGSTRSPIFYDSDNTGYYSNPDSDSYINSIRSVSGFRVASASTDLVNSAPWYGLGQSNVVGYNSPNVMVQLAGYYGLRFRSSGTILDLGGSNFGDGWAFLQGGFATNSQARATIFYDYSDTGYYVDPNSSSKLISLGIGGGTSNPTSLYIKSYSGASDGTNQIHKYYGTSASPSESSDWPTPILALRTFQDFSLDTFLSFGLSNDAIYKTDDTVWNFRLRGITNRTTSDSNTHLDIGGPGVLYFRNGYTEQVGGSLRAPIFYDSNDTGYYCDPNSYSSMNQLRLWGNEFWIRGGSPTIHFQDTDQYSAALHNNSNLFYVLRGGVDDTSWSTVGSGWWPCYWNLTNNDCTMGGNLSTAYNVIAYASDRRLKENIAEIPNALDKIKQIRGVTFDWNDEAEVLGFTPETKYNDLGVIAQEIQAVLPQAVKPAPFDQWFPDPSGDYEQEYLDQMMGTSRSGENYLTVQLDKIVPLLIEGIKEQQNQIEELREQIELLKEVK